MRERGIRGVESEAGRREEIVDVKPSGSPPVR